MRNPIVPILLVLAALLVVASAALAAPAEDVDAPATAALVTVLALSGVTAYLARNDRDL